MFCGIIRVTKKQIKRIKHTRLFYTKMSKDYSKYSTFLTFFSLIGFSTILKRAGIYKKRGLCSVEMFKEHLVSILIGNALDTLMNTFIDYVYALRDKKYQKKGCFDKALNLAKEKISSWFTQQIEYVKNYILSIQNELINNANF